MTQLQQGMTAHPFGRSFSAPPNLAEAEPVAAPRDEPEEEPSPPPSEAPIQLPGGAIPGPAIQAGTLTRGRIADLRAGTTFQHTLKLVYWGPGRSGKTTNVKWLHGRLRPELRGRLVTLDGPGERTLYFDCLPLDLDPDSGPPIQLRLYTVPGQPRFRLTRRLVLQGVDGIVFVWDARSRRLKANLESLIEARETVAELGLSWERIPRVFQYNKLDLPDRIPPDELDHVLDRMGECGSRISAVARNGTGVLESLGLIARAALCTRRQKDHATFTEHAATMGSAAAVW